MRVRENVILLSEFLPFCFKHNPNIIDNVERPSGTGKLTCTEPVRFVRFSISRTQVFVTTECLQCLNIWHFSVAQGHGAKYKVYSTVSVSWQ